MDSSNIDYYTVKYVLVLADSRHGSAASVHVRSARGKYTPTEGHSIPYVPATSKHNFIVPPSTSDYVQVKPKGNTNAYISVW